MEINQNVNNIDKNYFIQNNSIKIIKIYEFFNICEVVYSENNLKTFVDTSEIKEVCEIENCIAIHRMKGAVNERYFGILST